MNSLKKAGVSVPNNEVWIALHALKTGPVFITYAKYFSIIPDLRLWCNL
jgi:predicted nucleic acid-binding protein